MFVNQLVNEVSLTLCSVSHADPDAFMTTSILRSIMNKLVQFVICQVDSPKDNLDSRLESDSGSCSVKRADILVLMKQGPLTQPQPFPKDSTVSAEEGDIFSILKSKL